MKFNNFIESLFGSKVKVKILRALFRFQTKLFTSRELAGYIKVSHTAVLKSLKNLRGMNIIEVERHGTSNLIRLNMESYLYDGLRNFLSFESETLQNLKAEIRKSLPDAEKIVLFGSVALGVETLNSDIDLLIITKDKSKMEETLARKQENFSKRFGNIISAYVMTQGEFKRNRNKPFIKGLLKNHVMIKGGSL